MRIDAKDAERIARELIAEIVNEWQSVKGTEIVLDGDTYLFQFSLEPTEIYRYAHRVERPASNSLLLSIPHCVSAISLA